MNKYKTNEHRTIFLHLTGVLLPLHAVRLEMRYNTMRNIRFILILLLMCSCTYNKKSELIGSWKSDEDKTLNYIYSLNDIPPKAMDYFTDDFFGHLIVEYRESDTRSYFDNCEEDCDDRNCIETVCEKMKKYEPYEVIDETEEHFIIRFFDKFEGKNIEITLFREKDCYFVIGTKYNIKEYFCRDRNY